MTMAELFEFRMPVWEIVLRGSAIYWFLLLIFRFVMRREPGAVGVADLLVLVLIADAAQNAMAGGYTTLAEGMTLVATIVGWNIGVDWCAFHFPVVARLLEPPRVVLVTNGRILRRNLAREFMTVDELQSKLRQHGIDDVNDVKSASLESDGQIAVIRKKRRDVEVQPGKASLR